MKAEERENYYYEKGKVNSICQEEEILFSFLPNNAGSKKLLDVGCGVGDISVALKNKGFDVAGVDFSRVGVEKSKAKGIEAFLSDLDADGLKFPDKHFDVVWAGDVIEHVFDPLFLLQEIKRVLKDAGVFLFTVPNDFNVYIRLMVFLKGKSIQSGIYRKRRQCKHHTFFSWELLEFMLKDAGFKVEKYNSLVRYPLAKSKKTTANKILGCLFGNVFIVSANKL